MVDSDLILICSYCHSLKNRFNLLLNVLNYSAGPGRISSPSVCKVWDSHICRPDLNTFVANPVYTKQIGSKKI